MNAVSSVFLVIFLLKGFTIFFLEPFDPTRRIEKFLLSREKGVAVRADFDVDFFLRALRLEGCSTGTFDDSRS